MEEARYEENLELEGRSEDSGQTSSLEMLGDLESKVLEGSEREIGQEVIGIDSGGGSGSGSESLKQLANVELLIGGDDVRNLMVMTKKGQQLETMIGEGLEMMRMTSRGFRERGL